VERQVFRQVGVNRRGRVPPLLPPLVVGLFGDPERLLQTRNAIQRDSKAPSGHFGEAMPALMRVYEVVLVPSLD